MTPGEVERLRKEGDGEMEIPPHGTLREGLGGGGPSDQTVALAPKTPRTRLQGSEAPSRTYAAHASAVRACAFSPDGQTIVLAGAITVLELSGAL